MNISAIKFNYPMFRPVIKCKLSHLLIITLLISVSSAASAQSRDQLRSLFFDGVYLEEESEILLSSGSGNTGTQSSESPDNSPVQALDAAQLLDSIQEYEASINRMIENSGTFSPRLSQEYLALGLIYQQAGEHDKSVEAFENAMHVQRVNEGLFTMAQIEIVQTLIEGYKAVRNFAEADKYHEYLYYLMAQNLEPDDERLLAATLDWADWNLEAFRRMVFSREEGLAASSNFQNVGSSLLRRGELVPIENDLSSEILFVPRSAFLGSTGGGVQTYRAEQLLDPRLKNADEILDKLLENNPDDPEILHRKANIVQLFRTQLEQYVGNNVVGSNLSMNSNRLTRSVSIIRRGYSDSRDNLTEIAESRRADDPLGAASAYCDLGDWELLFDRTLRAENAYGQAREILLSEGFSEQEITEFISPEDALFIPKFIAYEDTRRFQGIPENLDIPYIGYIDVSFNKRRNGTLRNIRIESSSENTGQSVKSRLLALLRTAKTRPHYVDGDTVEKENIRLRYYYSY